VHRTPPNVDTLSGLFQDFYVVATTHINTHISALSSRQHRESSSQSVSSLASTASKFRAKAASFGNKERPNVASEKQDAEQMMLTAEEIGERKRARKALEHKRVVLEEAVERRVCQGVYDRIWRHRSTQDEAQDEKLRSKTAALAVVGIGLTDLGVDVGQSASENAEEKEKEVREWLEDARRHLAAMNDKQYPLGKLQHLKAAHKSIVDTLSHFHPSSSADEIMPMLIYTLITSRPEGINVMSNLYFIQRFRNEGKVDGEAAYCLTNLEAAITFLETVDLASLREDEVPSGPPKPSTPGPERAEPMTLPPSGPAAPAVSHANASPEISKAQPRQPTNRKLSNMFQPPPQVLGAAGAVRSTADQGFKSLGNSLGESYKFLLSKLKERQEDPSSPAADLVVPKTLDDARKLISPTVPEDDGSPSGSSSHNSPDPAQRQRSDSAAKAEGSIAGVMGGRKMAREGSADSSRSAASSTRKVAFAEDGADKAALPPAPSPAPSGNPAIVESMRSLGSSLNPMSRIAGIGFPRGFGRPTPAPAKPVDGGVADLTTVSSPRGSKSATDLRQAFPELAAELPPREVPKIAPPVKRFMELKNPGELRINEVLELLRDYRRLAGALKEAGAFEK
jgi:hypothetical protein